VSVYFIFVYSNLKIKMTTVKEEFPELFDVNKLPWSTRDLSYNGLGDLARCELLTVAKLLFRVLQADDPKQEIREVIKTLMKPVIDPDSELTVNEDRYSHEERDAAFKSGNDEHILAASKASYKKAQKRYKLNEEFLCEWTADGYVMKQMQLDRIREEKVRLSAYY
jgi:hypothetical protein